MTEFLSGLSEAEVEQRKKNGQVNGSFNIPTKSIKQILRTNLFTFFNLLNIILAFLVIAVGSARNALFIGVIVCNTAVGVIQEIRAKRIIDRLSLISAPKAHVIRGGKECEISVSEIVLGDVMRLSAGFQICADAEVIEGECEVNESLVTGESDPLSKFKGSSLLSGSFVICGEVYARVVGIGADNFANKIMSGAKYLKKPNSEMLKSLNKILKFITVCIIPIALILFYNSVYVTDEPLSTAVTSVVAAVIGMIPEGLILLVSMVLAVGGMRLSAHNTLVQDLYSIETLARVDVLCLDKTGTITEGRMCVEEVLSFGGMGENEVYNALNALTSALSDDNPTANAIREKCIKTEFSNPNGNICKIWKPLSAVSFSSARKWSGVFFENQGLYVMGAAEFILKEIPDRLRSETEKYAKAGKRAILLAHSPNSFTDDKKLPENLIPAALIIIGDKIREEAEATLRYFAEQGVEIKIISGDNPVTVKSIALAAGVKNAENCVDMSALSNYNSNENDNNDDSKDIISKTAEKYTVFGRVTPEQKLMLIKALKKSGRIVGMTGDGVNDVLALKEADCSVAMQSGSDAARNVSSLVLMDSNFASMPLVVAEGRKTINNIERSAALFLTKTVYSFFLAFVFLITAKPYPFIPIQLTLINALFIGIPSFLLALEPNTAIVRGNFIKNVLKKALPFGLCAVIGVAGVTAAGNFFNMINIISPADTRTVSIAVLALTSLITLFYICKPFNRKRVFMAITLGIAFVTAFSVFGEFFKFTEFSADMVITGAAAAIPALLMYPVFVKLTEVITSIRNKKIKNDRMKK